MVTFQDMSDIVVHGEVSVYATILNPVQSMHVSHCRTSFPPRPPGSS